VNKIVQERHRLSCTSFIYCLNLWKLFLCSFRSHGEFHFMIQIEIISVANKGTKEIKITQQPTAITSQIYFIRISFEISWVNIVHGFQLNEILPTGSGKKGSKLGAFLPSPTTVCILVIGQHRMSRPISIPLP